MKNLILTLISLFTLIIAFNPNLLAQCSGISENDSLDLVLFYNEANGNNWSNNSGWLESPVNEWYGITLTEDGCDVEAINLSGNNITTSDILIFGNTSVTSINLSNNNISGGFPIIPPNVEYLDISDNNLVYDLPDFWESFDELEYLDLSYNNIPSISDLYGSDTLISNSLKYLDLSNNGMEGEMVNFNMPNLEHLDLKDNKFSGTLPDFIDLSNLEYLDLSTNFWNLDNLSGEITDFNNLANLRYLNLKSNDLSGEITDFSNLTNLEYLDLRSNDLSGEITDFSSLPNLKYLDLKSNNLNGEIPDFNNLANLEYIDLSSCGLSGEITDFSNLPNLNILLLNNNGFNLIPNFSNLISLDTLNLDGNMINVIPNFSNLPDLDYLDIRENELNGEIIDFSNLPNLNYLDLRENELNGEIPDFSNLPNLNKLYLSENNLSGEIPDFSNLPNLTRLYLDDNELNGNIPDFSNLPALTTLLINNNELSGGIPDFFNLPLLNSLNISNNSFNGYIPNFSNLPYLNILTLCPNDLVGILPSFDNCPNVNPNSVNDECLDKSYVSGYVYYDLNGNCIKEEGEAGLPNVTVYSNDNFPLGFTNNEGYYRFGVIGNNTIQANIDTTLWSFNCSESYELSVTNSGEEIENINFALNAEYECPILNVNIGTPLLRRCFKNTYELEYCNTGTITAENAYIEVAFPENIIPLSSEEEYTEENGILTFQLGDLSIGQCGSFSIVDSVSCEAILGSGACIEAIIYPNEICTNDIIWDNAELNIEGFCEEDSIKFIIDNNGDDMSVATEYRVYENDILTIIETIQLNAGEETQIEYPNNNISYKIEVDQTPDHPLYTTVSATIENCEDEVFLLGTITSTPEFDESLAYEADCQEIIGSYDPNDKLAVPSGIGDQHFIEAEDELTYKIRFQNIGNDTAFNVIVVDTIDTNYLDLSSIKMAGSSHNYTLNIVGNRVEWYFENINLVDSTTNEPESHGFIQFKIEQQNNNPIGSVINNSAAIYFDYNEPIFTPITFHQIWIPDADNDGVPDEEDICQGGDDNLDTDNDGTPNACDSCQEGDMDDDNDGIPNDCDICENGDDNIDADNDGIPDDCDSCPSGDNNIDDDNDGIPNACDICQDGDDNLDDDNDGIPNACDICQEGDDNLDDDNDGVPNACDSCQEGDDNLDDDNDGIPNACDNCPDLANSDQADLDNNGIGDLCQESSVNNQNIYLNDINLYPNPAIGYCIINAPTTTIENIRLLDNYGREIITKQISSESDLKLNVSKLTPGLYYLHLYTKDGYAIQKLIKN